MKTPISCYEYSLLCKDSVQPTSFHGAPEGAGAHLKVLLLVLVRVLVLVLAFLPTYQVSGASASASAQQQSGGVEGGMESWSRKHMAQLLHIALGVQLHPDTGLPLACSAWDRCSRR